MSDQSSQPQFGTAEFESAGPDHCKFCNQPVGGQYYRVGEAMACGSCAERLKREMPVETGGAFVRALLFGTGAAFAGMALYATVAIVTGWEIGFVSLAVGWMVGKAVMKGSQGFGGRKYQVAAVGLTYAAVAVAAVPIGLYIMAKGEVPQAQVQGDGAKPAPAAEGRSADAKPDATKSDATAADDKEAKVEAAAETAEAAGGEQPMGVGTALVTLLLVGLASPFLALTNPGQGIIGLIILFVGIHTAWRMTASTPLVVDGPFDSSVSIPAKAGG